MKSIFSNINIKFLKDFSFVSFANIMDVLIPLLIYPYLIKILGLNTYGSVLYNLSVVALLSVIINYGFDLNGVKLISRSKGDKDKLNYIYSNVFYVKVMIFIPVYSCFCIYAFIFSSEPFISFMFSLILFQYLFVNEWFFIGMENIKQSVVIRFFTKVIFLALVFIFVRNNNPNSLVYIYIFNSFFISLLYIYTVFYLNKIKLISFSFKNSISFFKEGFDLFYSSFFIAIKDKLSIIILGVFFSKDLIVIYDFAIKLITVVSMPVGIFNSLLYPKITKGRNIDLFILAIKSLFFYSVVAFLFVFLLIDFFPFDYFSISNKYKDIFLMFFIVPIFTSLSQTISRNYLSAFDFKREFYLSINITMFLYFSSMFVFISLPIKTFFVFCFLIVFIYFLEFVVRLIFMLKTWKRV